MSTVYNGDIIRKASCNDVLNLLQSKLDDFNNEFNTQFKKEFVKYFFKQIDYALIEKSNKCCKHKNMYDFESDFHNLYYDRNTTYNFAELIFCLFPYKNNVLIMNFSDSIYNDIYKSFGFEDFSYWNNSDMPEEFSTRQWKRRLEIWEKVCPDCPASHSLMYRPAFNRKEHMPFLWKYQDLEKYFKFYNKEKRFEMYCANHDFANQYMNKNKPNPWIDVKDKMIDINESNFNDAFKYKENK